MSIPIIAGISDDELILYAIRDAQLALARHIEAGPGVAEETINLLLETLDRADVVAATHRLFLQYGLRPSK